MFLSCLCVEQEIMFKAFSFSCANIILWHKMTLINCYILSKSKYSHFGKVINSECVKLQTFWINSHLLYLLWHVWFKLVGTLLCQSTPCKWSGASHSRNHVITKLLLEAKDEVSASLNLTFPIYKMEMIAVVHSFVTKNKGVNVHKMLRTVPGT